MADCNVYEPLLHCVLDGEATPEERQMVMEHLEDCEACREKFQQLTELHMAFAELDTEVPAGLTAGVMERVRRESAGRRRERGRRWVGGVLALAACCAIVFLGAQELSGSRSNGAAPESADLNTTVYSADAGGGDAMNGVAGAKRSDGEKAPEDQGPSVELFVDSQEENGASAVETSEPAVGLWLEENRPGESGEILLSAQETEALSDWLAEQGVTLALPEGPVLLRYLG